MKLIDLTGGSMSDWPDIIAKARIWRARPPSGRFILHWLPKAGWCNRCGPVTRYHTCSATCRDNGFTCLPGCSAACNAPGAA